MPDIDNLKPNVQYSVAVMSFQTTISISFLMLVGNGSVLLRGRDVFHIGFDEAFVGLDLPLLIILIYTKRDGLSNQAF